MKLTKMHPKQLLGMAFEFTIAVVVVAYLGLNSFRFWEWTFPPEQWYFAFLGFGLTGGAAIGYLFVFLWRADSSLRRTISLVMLVVCVIGELLTAGFGIQVEVWERAGYQMTQDDFDFMTIVVQAIGFIHALAILGYYAGDRIAEMFGDADGDGTPNFRDPDYKPNTRSTTPAKAHQKSHNAPQSKPASNWSVADLEKATGMNRNAILMKYPDKQQFKNFASTQFDYISGGNLERLFVELMGTGNGHKNPQVGQRP